MDPLHLFRLTCIVLMVAVSVSGCRNSQSDKTISRSAPVFPVIDKTVILATIQADEKLRSLIPPSGPEAHAPTSSIQGVLFANNGGGVAYTSVKEAKGSVVHNGKPGSLYTAFGAVVLSPDGSRIAYSAVVDDKWRMVVDGVAGELLSEIKDLQFSPDGRHVAYQAMKDGVWHLVIDSTVNAGTKTRYRTPQFSGNSASIIYIDNIDDKDKGRLVVCDIRFNKERIINSDASNFVLSADKSAVAIRVKTRNGSENISQFKFSEPDVVMKGADFDTVRNIVFAPKGSDLVYIGARQGKTYGVFNAQEEMLSEDLTPQDIVINLMGKSVGFLMSAKNTYFLYQMFHNSGRLGNVYDEAEGLVYSSDGAMTAFAARKRNNGFVVANGSEGPVFDRVVTPKFSPDGKYLVYRARKDGKRFVVVADTSGKTMRQYPPYEQVFDVKFTADGKSVAYGVKDGKSLIWKVEKL